MTKKPFKILGIESSCDETAAAVVTSEAKILSNSVFSQLEEHLPYMGVVPEIAARAHVKHIDRLIIEALKEANTNLDDISLIAATGGPGLIGGVMVGIMAAKAMAAATKTPFIAVNHLEGHALTPRLSNNIPFPYLLLLVSGGHTQLLMVESATKYELLGSTLDDAAGEAFDKSAKIMGLGYPGGPELEKAAKDGDLEIAQNYKLPRPLKGRKNCDFSFSGLKTALKQKIDKLPEGKLDYQDVANLSLAFQEATADVLIDRTNNAIKIFKNKYGTNAKNIVIAGGVAANKYLNNKLQNLAKNHNLKFTAPPLSLCTDNAAMIAWAGYENYKQNGTTPLNFRPRPRWALGETHSQ